MKTAPGSAEHGESMKLQIVANRCGKEISSAQMRNFTMHCLR